MDKNRYSVSTVFSKNDGIATHKALRVVIVDATSNEEALGIALAHLKEKETSIKNYSLELWAVMDVLSKPIN